MGRLSGNKAMLPAYQLRSQRCEAQFPRKSSAYLGFIKKVLMLADEELWIQTAPRPHLSRGSPLPGERLAIRTSVLQFRHRLRA